MLPGSHDAPHASSPTCGLPTLSPWCWVAVPWQMVAVLSRGVTIVVSPLISLMQDQVRSLLQTGDGVPAIAITSTMKEGQARSAFAELGRGASSPLKPLYIAPEKLQASGTLSNILDRLYEQV